MSKRDETIVLESLTIGYKQNRGLKIVNSNINASLFSGELTSLLGANGIGKSTLLRTMTAIQPALDGEVFYQGKNLKSYTPRTLSSVISIVLTNRINIKNLKVFDLVGYGRSPYSGFWGKMSKADTIIIRESLALVGIEHLTDRMVHTLSDGERQKVMIAKALAQQTPVIILDEPTAFLDFPSKVEMMHLLKRLSKEVNKTIFLSTHDLDLSLQVSDRIWLMDKDRGIKVGTPEDLALDGSLSSFFERKGIVFNRESGLFGVDNPLSREIAVTGEGVRYLMVKKALMRNGIEVKEQIEGGDMAIEVSKEAITVTYKSGKSEVADTIDQLLNIIAQ